MQLQPSKQLLSNAAKQSETSKQLLLNGAKQSETDPPKAQAQRIYILLSLIIIIIISYLRHSSTWNCRRTDKMIPTYMELSTDRQYYSNVPLKSVYGIVDGQNSLMDRHYVLSSMFCTYIHIHRKKRDLNVGPRCTYTGKYTEKKRDLNVGPPWEGI